MKKFWIILIIILGFVYASIFYASFGNEESVETYHYTTGKVTAESLKIRSGLSLENDYIGILKKDEIVNIYGKVDNWYIIKSENNLVGAVCADYIQGDLKENSETIETSSSNVETAENPTEVSLSQEEQVFLNLINNKRIENNLPTFQIDENLLNVARLKAQDIVQKNYFSHTSPTYGTFFEMLKNNDIQYSNASENIARNATSEKAVECLMASESHKTNILSQDFNYTGIAVQNSPQYGKIFVEIFVSK